MQRKVGTEKAYPQKVKFPNSLMEQKECLFANCGGIMDNFNDQEKPTFYPEELITNRKRGLSYVCFKQQE